MYKALFAKSILLLYCLELFSVSDGKHSLSYKGLKKLSKYEVNLKSYLFPCSLDDAPIINSTFDRRHQHLRNCKKKLVIKMAIQSGGESYSKSDGFIAIDHVIDGISGRKKRLINPLMIRIKRERMNQLYNLQLVKTINAEAKEEIVNYENTANFSGCDTSSSRPTCGFSFFNNKIIQFSEGFCCSCDQAKNDERQPCEGHLSDGKKISHESEQKISHRRNNRSSRGMEFLGSDITMNDQETNHTPEINKRSPVFRNINSKNVEKVNQIDSKQKSNAKILLPDLNNITIRAFQFEWTQAPQNVKHDNFHMLSNLNMVIDSGDIMNKQENNNYATNKSNSISEDTLKIFMLNKIKQNKKEEKLNNLTPILGINTQPSLNKSLANVDVGKVGQEMFAKNLIRGDSEDKIEHLKKLEETYSIKREPEDCKYLTRPEIPSRNSHLNEINVNNLATVKDTVNNKDTKPHYTGEIRNVYSVKEGPQEQIKNKKWQNSDIDSDVYKFIPLLNTRHSEKDYIAATNSILKGKNMTNNKFITEKEATYLKKNQSELHSLNSSDSFQLNVLSPVPQQLNRNRIFNNNVQHNENPMNTSNLMQDVQNQIIKKRENDKQIRGGQSCCTKNKHIPSKANKETYFESAHCLRFSDLWYNVHKLVNPRMENSITIKMYNKHKTQDTRVCWENLTKRLHGG